MKTKIFTILIIVSICISALSQEKQEFVYKTVKGHEIKANIFVPVKEGLRPVVIYFHGGGFMFGNRDQGLDLVLKEKLLAAHYAVVSADYRLAPETKLEGILEDTEDLVKWIRLNGTKEFNIDTSRLAVAGGSAGGYLAFASGFNIRQCPKAIVAISAPTGFSAPASMGDPEILNQPGPYNIVKKDSVVTYGDYDTRIALWRFLAQNDLAIYEIFGFDASKDTARLNRFRLTTNIHDRYPPTLLIYSRNDRLVDLLQAEQLHQFLTGKNIPAEMFIFENGHSTELTRQQPEAADKIVDFLNKYLNRP